VVVQLAPTFAPVHVANIRAYVRAGWFSGGAIVRVQDNYVVQWVAREQPDRPLPAGVLAKPPAEYDVPDAGAAFRPLGYRDTYAAETGHVGSWPVAREGGRRWLTHCYGMVGVGRDNAPDTGNGAELYAVIGQAPRQLDRNIALVGRVLAGVERMASLPRGTEALGFYKTRAERVTIVSAQIASDMPAAMRPLLPPGPRSAPTARTPFTCGQLPRWTYAMHCRRCALDREIIRYAQILPQHSADSVGGPV
jgi:peptidylprolyl isomerase